MKLKKGDVYKEPKGKRWFKIYSIHVKRYVVEWPDNSGGVFIESVILDLINSGKLIKIPQLYK